MDSGCHTSDVGLGLWDGTNARDIVWGRGGGSHIVWTQYHEMWLATAYGLQSHVMLLGLPIIIPLSSGVCLRLSLANVLGIMIIESVWENVNACIQILQAHYSQEITSSLYQFLSEVINLLVKNFQAYLKTGCFSALLMVKSSFLWNWNNLALLKMNSSSLEAFTIVCEVGSVRGSLVCLGTVWKGWFHSLPTVLSSRASCKYLPSVCPTWDSGEHASEPDCMVSRFKDFFSLLRWLMICYYVPDILLSTSLSWPYWVFVCEVDSPPTFLHRQNWGSES